MDIGQRIKNLRNKMGLTLEELASRTELTKGFLSQLENDLNSPSIATLQDISEALGVTLEEFFKEEKNEKIVFKEEDYFVDEKEDLTIKYIVPNSQKNEMEPIMLEIKTNGQSKEIPPHEGEEFGYVISGRITLLNLETNEKHIVKKGETFYLKGEYTHCIINENYQVAKVLWTCCPPIF